MAYFWVNLGKSAKEVEKQKFLWAPAYSLNASGKKTVNAGWRAVPHVKRHDVIFCNTGAKIVYLAYAESDAYTAPPPPERTFDEWKQDGYQVDVSLIKLTKSVATASFKTDFMALYNEDCFPKVFNKLGKTTESYMYTLPAGAGALILDALGEEAEDPRLASNSTGAPTKLTKTEREVVNKARIGQGRYRDDMLELWDCKCPVTGIDLPELLTASHAHSWQLSDNDQRLDKFNGFPLSPDIDRLFDRGLVSFTDQGKLLMSNRISEAQLNSLGLSSSDKLSHIHPENVPYLKLHRERFKITG